MQLKDLNSEVFMASVSSCPLVITPFLIHSFNSNIPVHRWNRIFYSVVVEVAVVIVDSCCYCTRCCCCAVIVIFVIAVVGTIVAVVLSILFIDATAVFAFF